MSELHRILGVPTNATRGQIKKAFRNKAKLVHPDVNDSRKAHEEFLKLTAAYDGLLNPSPHKTTKQPTPTGPTQSSFDKFKYVYTAPTDPQEYQEWLEVAKERARQQTKKDYELLMQEVALLKKIGQFLKIPSIAMALWCIFVLVDLTVLPTKVLEEKIVQVESALSYGELNVYTENLSFTGSEIDRYIFAAGNDVQAEVSPLLGVKDVVYIFSDGYVYSNEYYHPMYIALIVFTSIALCISLVVISRWKKFNASLLVVFYFGCVFEFVGIAFAMLR